ncbi:MAG: hypothetical protein JWP12_1376 [Bacteroidetes bacterium]|nr:hypothetical protein [Bacteroidota bacterium]
MEATNKILPVKKTCYKCNATFDSYLNSNAYSIICSDCGTLYTAYNGALAKTSDVVNKPAQPLDIPLGAQGTINKIPYVVVGYAYKKENGTSYFWHEYTLFNPVHGPAYLAQYEGHWTYLKEIKGLPIITEGRTATYRDFEYSLFSKYRAKLSTACGESIYQFSISEIPAVEEYISPPFMITKEQTADNITWYIGEYIQPSEIKSTFTLTAIPDRVGTGMIQPYIGRFTTAAFRKVLIAVALIWGLSQFYFLMASKEEAVFSQSFGVTDSLNKKEVYSRPFQLKYGTANTEIKISTNIDNNWMYTGITLVNEKTGDLYDVDLEAEYYHGYTDGENWSEGENWVSKVVSQVPEGSYYMIIYPEKPTNMSYASITVSVTRDVYIFSNGLIALVVLAIFPIFYFYRKNRFEKNRWYNSDFSPYDTGTDDDDN